MWTLNYELGQVPFICLFATKSFLGFNFAAILSYKEKQNLHIKKRLISTMFLFTVSDELVYDNCFNFHFLRLLMQ